MEKRRPGRPRDLFGWDGYGQPRWTDVPSAELVIVFMEAERGWCPRPTRPGVDDSEPLLAYLNCGRWLVQCNAPDPRQSNQPCHSAQLTGEDDPRFFCVECQNQAVGGRWRKVTWPAAGRVAGVEAAVDGLPEDDQNWRPHEPVPPSGRQSAPGV